MRIAHARYYVIRSKKEGHITVLSQFPEIVHSYSIGDFPNAKL